MAEPKEREVTKEDLLKLIEAVAFTPEKLAMLAHELKKPYVDPAAEEREQRERLKIRADLQQAVKLAQEAQAQCTHKYKTGANAVRLMHNFPDGLPRGTCAKCNLFIHPEYWEYAYDPRNPEGKAYCVPEHPLWRELVLELEVSQEA